MVNDQHKPRQILLKNLYGGMLLAGRDARAGGEGSQNSDLELVFC